MIRLALIGVMLSVLLMGCKGLTWDKVKEVIGGISDIPSAAYQDTKDTVGTVVGEGQDVGDKVMGKEEKK